MKSPNPHSLAHEVREEEGLPPDGRDALRDIRRVERLVRAAMAPDVPTYDVGSVQGVAFQEWCYSDAFGCVILWTQSVEINTRIALEAVATGAGDDTDHAVRLLDRLGDKWALKHAVVRPRKVWFPPGGNLGYLVAADQVLRTFDEDGDWVLKPHPITSDEDVREAVRAFGAQRVLPREISGYQLLRTAEVVGYTTTSEMGIVAWLQRIEAVDFSLYAEEHRGRLYSIYRAIRESGVDPCAALSRLVRCPWSGVIPLTEADESVTHRTRAFKARSLELRERLRPLVPRSKF